MSRSLLVALRAALTVAFLYFGLRKLLGGSADIAVYEAIGMGQWPRYVTGSVETAAALGLWVPGWRGRAALLLVATMIAGLSALLLFTALPFWHLIALGAAAASVAWGYRHEISPLPAP